MYDRATRPLTQAELSTAEHVGPGTYDGAPVNLKKVKADGYAPFLSMTSRDSFLNPTDQVIAAPGPGQYDPRNAQHTVAGGRAMANKSKRFKNEVVTYAETPGPGAYSLSKKSDWIRKTSVLPNDAAKSKDGKGNNLMTSRVKFHRKPEAPSIPSPGQAYGYEENEDGTLMKQDAPDKDASIGPAFYQADKTNDPVSTKTYKGIHFGKLTSRRMEFGGKEGPGPGEYEPYHGHQMEVEHANMREMEKIRFESKLPRYHEMVAIQEEKKAVPGPGKYDINGGFEISPPKVNTEGIEVEHPPFGSQAKRFGPNKDLVPAPGSYNDPRSALEIMRKVTGLKRSPFGQTSVRFGQDHHIKRTPGPGAYNHSGIGSDSMRKAYIESTRRGVFGTTSVRIQPMTRPMENEQPGPSHYQVKEKPFKPRYQQPSSTFASLSNRLQESGSAVKDMPPPGAYEVSRSYMNTQNKIIPGKPRTDEGKRKQGAFQSSSSRFAPPRDVVIDETDPNLPGPGTYKPQFAQDKKGNMMITKDNRFKILGKHEVPGPGTYEYSPLLQDTVLKGTFNATLNNPIAPRMEAMGGVAAANQPFLLGV